jgi:hypothetical protein
MSKALFAKVDRFAEVVTRLEARVAQLEASVGKPQPWPDAEDMRTPGAVIYAEPEAEQRRGPGRPRKDAA